MNDGCTPTKAMVASAYAAFLARRAGEYGVVVGEPRVDFGAVMARKDAIVAKSSGGVEKWMTGLKGAKVFRGHARFTGPDAVEVDGERLIRHLVDGQVVLEYSQPQLDDKDADARPLLPKRADKQLREGYIYLQAESHPVEFRRVEMMPLE